MQLAIHSTAQTKSGESTEGETRPKWAASHKCASSARKKTKINFWGSVLLQMGVSLALHLCAHQASLTLQQSAQGNRPENTCRIWR
jgi:hypothetical protein